MPEKVRLEIDYNLVAKRTDNVDLNVKGLLEYDSNSVSLRIRRSF